MPSTPRTWTLELVRYEAGRDLSGQPVYAARIGVVGDLDAGERVEVIEKAPVDAERERMLEMLESFVKGFGFARASAESLLREHGRLGGNDE